MKAYESPKIEDLGSVAGFTRGEATGSFVDRDFPRGTPNDQLTFSS